MRLIGLLSGFLLLFSCSSETPASDLHFDSDTASQLADTSVLTNIDSSSTSVGYTAEIFETPGLGWGYKIYDNGTLFINQPHIPAIQGNKGFSTKEKAQITADFAILKLQQGFVPPTISPEELDSLNVLD